MEIVEEDGRVHREKRKTQVARHYDFPCWLFVSVCLFIIRYDVGRVS